MHSTDFNNNNETISYSCPLEIKFSGGDQDTGIVSGYASTFGGNPDSYGDVIQKGAFEDTIVQHKQNGTMPLMLWNHDQGLVVGKWLEMREDDHGLFIRGLINLKTTHGRDAYAHVLANDVNGLSIGFIKSANGHSRLQGGARLLTKLKLMEVSIVGMPANESARISHVKSFSSRSELESTLRTVLPARAVKKLLSGGWSAFSSEDDETPQMDGLMSAIKTARAELQSYKEKKQ